MGIAGRALTVWQEAGEELITQIYVEQVFQSAQISSTTPLCWNLVFHSSLLVVRIQ